MARVTMPMLKKPLRTSSRCLGQEGLRQPRASNQTSYSSISARLPYRSLESIRERLNLILPERQPCCAVPLRTLARRKVAKRLAA